MAGTSLSSPGMPPYPSGDREKLNANPSMVRQRALVRDFSEESHLWYPKSVAIDNEGRILIVDSNRGRIQVYQKDS